MAFLQKKLKYCKRLITSINCEILTGKREKRKLREVNKGKTKLFRSTQSPPKSLYCLPASLAVLLPNWRRD